MSIRASSWATAILGMGTFSFVGYLSIKMPPVYDALLEKDPYQVDMLTGEILGEEGLGYGPADMFLSFPPWVWFVSGIFLGLLVLSKDLHPATEEESHAMAVLLFIMLFLGASFSFILPLMGPLSMGTLP